MTARKKKTTKKKVAKKKASKKTTGLSFNEALEYIKQVTDNYVLHMVERESWGEKEAASRKAISYFDGALYLHYGNTKSKLNAVNVESILANDWQIVL